MFFKRKKAKNSVTDDTPNATPQNENIPTGDTIPPGTSENPARNIVNSAEPSTPNSNTTLSGAPDAKAPLSDIQNPDGVRPGAAGASNAATETDTEETVRPGHEAPRETTSGNGPERGSVLITLSAIVMALVLLGLFTAFMPHRPLWLTQEPQTMATAESGVWLPGSPAITPYPLFNWLVMGLEHICRTTLNFAPESTLKAAAYICMALFLLSALSLSKATGQPRKTGMAAVLVLFSMGPVAGLAWFARPETLFAGLLTLAFGYFLWAAKRPRAPVFMIFAAIAATLALLCGGIWGAILPVLGLILFCLLGLKPKRLLAVDTAIAIGLIIAVPLIFGVGLMLFADRGAAEAFFSSLGRGFLRAIAVPGGLPALWRTPLLLVCLALPWLLDVFFLTPRRARCWINTLPLWLILICLAIWGGLRVSGDPVRDTLILLPVLPPLAVILARWAMLLPQPRIGIFTRLAGLILFLGGLAAVILSIVHAASLTSVEAMLPVRIPEFMPFWSTLVPGIIAIAAGVAVWSAATRVEEFKAIATIAIAILITGQAVGQFFLPQIAPRFTFSVIGPAIQAYARDGVPTFAVAMPPNSLYAWSPDITYVNTLADVPANQESYALVMPLSLWEQNAASLPTASTISQEVGRENYVFAPVFSQTPEIEPSKAESTMPEETGSKDETPSANEMIPSSNDAASDTAVTPQAQPTGPGQPEAADNEIPPLNQKNDNSIETEKTDAASAPVSPEENPDENANTHSNDSMNGPGDTTPSPAPENAPEPSRASNPEQETPEEAFF